MECREFEEKLLETFETDLSPREKNELDAQMSECAECAQFAREQAALDLRLRGALPPPRLSAGFDVALRARILREQQESWPEWLPTVAHLAGSGVAIALCALSLPVPTAAVLGAGILAAIVTYSLQTFLISAMDQK